MADEKQTYVLTIELDCLPPWIMRKVERLNFLIEILANVGPREIKIYPEERINELKAYISEAQSLYDSLIGEDNIVNLVGQNRAWVAIDKLAVQELTTKPKLIDELWTGGANVSDKVEFVDESKELPTDDFSDEDEEDSSFW